VLTPTPIDTQFAALEGDSLRVLVVGAGVAGTALTQLLRSQGLHPMLIERAAPQGNPGYMLALMPMVDPVIDDLGVRTAYFAQGTALDRYRLRSHIGRVIRDDPMGELMSRYGDYRGISRGDLLDVLGSAGGSASYQTTVTAIRQDQEQATAVLRSPSGEREVTLDLIIAADGLHSQTRSLILDEGAVEFVTPVGAAGWPGPMPTTRATWARNSGAPTSSSAHTRY
jgi:salicylate hydroxylase